MSTTLPAVSVITPVLHAEHHLCDAFGAKLLLAGFVAGGRAAVRAIAAAEYDVLPGPPKPGKVQLLREAGVILRGEG